MTSEVSASAFYDLVAGQRGHFLLESGLHSQLWLDLDPLFADQKRLEPFVASLAELIRRYEVDVVCGALVGGAFLAQLLAQKLDVEFSYTEHLISPEADGLFQARYRLPPAYASRVASKRVAIVDDVMSAGSSLRSTYSELRTAGANVVVAGALLVLGDTGAAYFAAEQVPVVFGARDAFAMWTPAECPLCASSVPLTRPVAAG